MSNQFLFQNDTISDQRFENATIMADNVTFLRCKFVNCTILEGLVSYVQSRSINSNRTPYSGPWTFEPVQDEIEGDDDEGESLNEINTGGTMYNEGGTINHYDGVFNAGRVNGPITYIQYK